MDTKLQLLSRDIFAQDTTTVARLVLGKILMRRTPSGLLLARIVETEAYIGEHDPAAHASFGRTKRTEALYGDPGHAYIFSIHGYSCLNFVAEPRNSPGCVLIRAVEPLKGHELMREYRGKNSLKLEHIANGPGKLCRAMDIDKTLYGIDLLDSTSPLQVCEIIEDNAPEIQTSRRIGISKAADWELRFTLAGSLFISRQPPSH